MTEQRSGKYNIDPIYLKVSVRTYNCDELQKSPVYGKASKHPFFKHLYPLQQSHNMNSFRQMQYI